MRTLLAMVVLASGLIVPEAIPGQEPLRLRVDVSLVTVDVEVVDPSDRPVTTLSRDDFQIYEDGALQQLRSFDAVETPYNILLLFDCSASTEKDWPFLIEAMGRFTKMLRPQDRIAIAEFGSGFKTLQPWFSRTASPIEVKIQTRDSVCNGTDFYGAIRRSLDQMQGITGRKGIVILSDGEHGGIPYQKNRAALLTGSRYVDSVDDAGFQRLLRTCRNTSAVLYFVAINTDLNPRGETSAGTVALGSFDPDDIYNKQQIRARLEQLAAATGGRVVFPKGSDEVVNLYERMARELGASYSLGYAPPNPEKEGVYRKIEVRVRDRSLRVRQSREGYLP